MVHPGFPTCGIHGAMPYVRKYAPTCFRSMQPQDLAHARIAMYVNVPALCTRYRKKQKQIKYK